MIAFTMLKDQKKTICTIQPDGTDLSCMEPGSIDNYSVSWSPDGQKLAYLSGESSETAKITIQDYITGKVDQVDVVGVTFFTWSPDGQRIAFLSRKPPQKANFSIFDSLTRKVTRWMLPV
jgi:Tol biopolymer transport system component